MKIKIIKTVDQMLHLNDVEETEVIKIYAIDRDGIQYTIDIDGLFGGNEDWLSIQADDRVMIQPEASNYVRIRQKRRIR